MGIQLSELVPSNFFPTQLSGLLDDITVTDFSISTANNQLAFSLILESSNGLLEIPIGGNQGLAIVFDQLGMMEVSLQRAPSFSFTLNQLTIKLPQFLHPASKQNGDWIPDETQRQEMTLSSATGLVIQLDAETGFKIGSQADPNGSAIMFSLSPTMIGGSGIVISANNVSVDLDDRGPVMAFAEAAVDLPDNIPIAPDLRFTNCIISPDGFTGTVVGEWNLSFDSQTGSFDGNAAGELFGFSGGLRRFALTFQDNAIIESDIQGAMKIPYFDESDPIEVRLNVTGNGDFSVTLLGLNEDGITLTKQELVSLKIQSLKLDYDKKENTASAVINGGMQPLLFASDGLEWPQLEVQELSIEKNLTNLSDPPILKFKEAWVDLKELVTLDLFGFHFELNRIGVGYQENDDKLWIDLTGSVKLIEQIPLGVGVEGFRITWPRSLYQDLGLDDLFQGDPSYTLTAQDAINIASKIEVKFDGVYLFYGVPNAAEFEGYIRFLKEAQKVGFAGDVILRIPASGLEIEAGLMIGMNFEDPPYPFLYVYFGIMLPTGIPLGQSGLALKGAKGLFGLNVTPAKTPEQNWYYDWYKRGPLEGAHPTNKWTDLRMALAVGAGITITTTDGKLLGVQGLLVLAIPGPFIMIEGKALIFDGVFPGDPPLKALAIFDGSAKTVQLNIEAGVELIEDVLEANGVAEAFFDFKDLTNWHLYLGQDEPEDRRVHALILKLAGSYLFKADAYLMTDMIQPYTVRSRLGVFIGFAPPIPPMGPAQIKMDAVISGLGELTIRAGELLSDAASASLSAESALDTVNFSGQLDLNANLEISAFGFGLSAAVHAQVMGEGPKPFEVSGKLNVSVDLPSPLAAVESIPVVNNFLEFVEQTVEIPEIEPIEIDIEFVFRPNDFTVPDLVSPLRSTIALESHFIQKSEEAKIQKGLANFESAVNSAKKSPVIEMDHRPAMIFHNEMNVSNDSALMAAPIAAHPAGLKKFNQGMVTFKPTLKRIMLFEHDKSQPWDENLEAANSNTPDANWTKIADTAIAEFNDTQDIKPLYGIWRADADAANPEQAPRRTLRLWSTMPFGPAVGSAYYNALFGVPNQIEAAAQTHDAFFIGGASKAKKTCVNFKKISQLRLQLPNAQKTQLERLPIENPLTVEDLSLTGQLGLFVSTNKKEPCLICPGNLQIKFSQLVRWVEITFCKSIPNIIITQTSTLTSEKSGEKDVPYNIEIKRRNVQSARESTNSRTVLITSEDPFDQIVIMRQATCICQVCYKTHDDLQNEEVDEDQLSTNDELFTPTYLGSQPILKPGRHYRIVVQSEVEANANPASNPFPEGSFLYDKANSLAGNIVNDILGAPSGSKPFTDEAYFQTDGPPTNLQRFIKWTTPQLNEKRFFRDDDFLIRFKRSYIKDFFSEDAFQLNAYVRSSNGIIFDNWNTRWIKPQSSTLTPDEQAWLAHLKNKPQYESLLESIAKDDILRISVPTITDLSPATGSGWDIVDLNPRLQSNWQVLDDLRFDASIQVLRQSHQAYAIAIARNSNCGEFCFTSALFSGVAKAIGVVFRYLDSKNYYRFSFDPQSSKQKLVKVVNGEQQAILEKPFEFQPN